jgi:alanine-glyoxylate transaminase/serine-glyoxylate transaminase/serine-pyruvate transaminase
MSEILPPSDLPLSNLLPSEPILLMGAGPVPIPHAVAQANGVVINHLGKTMDEVIHRVKKMAAYAFQTHSEHIFGISGPSSAAMEMAISSVLTKGRKVLVLNLGTFSARFGQMASGMQADVVELKNENEPFTVEQVEQALSKDQFHAVTIVQGETSCGVKNIHLEQIAKVVKDHGALMIVDTVCTLTTMPLYMDKWGLDIVVTGGQKGLSSIPGVSLIAYSQKAWDVVNDRISPCPHWCLDPRRAEKFWKHRQYHYTAPVPGILAIHEALRLICNETLEKRFERHEISSKALQAGILAMGLELFIPEPFRLNSVVSIINPNQIESTKLIQYMINTFKVEISGAFGLDIVRIGQMGEQCRSHNLFKVLYALGMSFQHFGHDLDIAGGMAALEENLVKDPEHFVE